MSIIIDQRNTNRDKHLINRDRLFQRSKEAIKKSLKDNISNRKIADSGGGDVTIPSKGLSEPSFRHGRGGKRDFVLPGNDQFDRGDEIRKQSEGGKQIGSGGDGNDANEQEDEFVYTMNREEFLDVFFEDLDLPDLVKTSLKDMKDFKWCRAGYSPVGIPANLDIGKTMIQALGRNYALRGIYEKKIKELTQILMTEDLADHNALQMEIKSLEKKRDSIPFMDDFDLRYRLFVKQPKPITKAVMFCLMDVSVSMGEYEKDLAKRFYILLHLFLTRRYDEVDVVFVRHTDNAKEVDEQEFFYGKESGGTKVSVGLELVRDIIKARYPSSDYNVYVSQCSDGDNSFVDNIKCKSVIMQDLMKLVQYFAYVQIGHEFNQEYGMWGSYNSSSGLWPTYQEIQGAVPNFKCQRLNTPKDIYPVFRELFKKDIK